MMAAVIEAKVEAKIEAKYPLLKSMDDKTFALPSESASYSGKLLTLTNSGIAEEVKCPAILLEHLRAYISHWGATENKMNRKGDIGTVDLKLEMVMDAWDAKWISTLTQENTIHLLNAVNTLGMEELLYKLSWHAAMLAISASCKGKLDPEALTKHWASIRGAAKKEALPKKE